jgi:hypothetical protein
VHRAEQCQQRVGAHVDQHSIILRSGSSNDDVRREMAEVGDDTVCVVILGLFVGKTMEWVFEIFTLVVCK